MNSRTTKFVLFSFTLLCERIFPVMSLNNPSELPIISVNLEDDVVPQPQIPPGTRSILHLFGENSILNATFTKIILTCTANYLIRWDSTIPVESYDLPRRYREGDEYGRNGLPKHFRYETSVKLIINSTTTGFVLCVKLGDSAKASELMIHGKEAAYHLGKQSLREGRTLSASKIKAWCNEGLYYQQNGDYQWHTLRENAIFQVFEQFGLVVKTDFSSIDYHYSNVVPQLLDFLIKNEPYCGHRIGCSQWSCSNPLHCIIAERTTKPASPCYFNRNPSRHRHECAGRPKSWFYYTHEYAGFTGQNSWYPEGVVVSRYAYFHSTLMTISEQPADQMVANRRVTYKCLAVSFLLGQQIVFGIKFRNSTVRYLDSFSKPETTEQLQDGGVLSRTMDVILMPEMMEVICMAPRFDSYQWYNISAKISLTRHAEEKKEVPKIESSTIIWKTTTTPNIGGEEEYTTNTTPSGSPKQPSTINHDKKTSTVWSFPPSTHLTSTTAATTTDDSKISTITGVSTSTPLTSTTTVAITSATTGVTIATVSAEEADKAGVDGDSNVTIIIVAALALFVLFLIPGTCCGLRYAKFNKSTRALTDEEIEQFRRGLYRASVVRNTVALGLTNQTTPFENEISETDIQIEHGNLIAQDAFLSVFPATIKARKAIVRTTDEKTTTLFFKEFLKDIKIMNHISVCSHPNIVDFLGAVTPKIQNRIISAGYEASSLGTLKDFLRSNSTSCINLMQGNSDTGNVAQARYTTEVNHKEVTTLMMLQWFDQIATAMAFLQRENLVHGDLSASNILLFPENCVKISDLSLWRKQYERDFYLANYKPPPKWRWMAIELFRSKKFTIKSDVWAYGVTLWEIFSLGEDPHPGVKWSPDFVLKLEGGYRMDRPSRANQDIYQLLLCCWYRYPNDRPSFGEVKERIGEFIKRLQ